MPKKMTPASAKTKPAARPTKPVAKSRPAAKAAAPAWRPATRREDDVFARASAMMRSVPRAPALERGVPAKVGKGRMVRGSELLVVLSVGLMVAVLAAAFAAAGYYTSLSVAPTDIIVGSQGAGAVQAAAEVAEAPASESGSDKMPFLVVPGTLTDGIVRAPAGVELSMVGTAPGAQEVELVFVQSGDGSTGNEQVVGYGTVGSDGAFDLRATFASGTVGRIMIKAKSDGETVGESGFKGIITE